LYISKTVSKVVVDVLFPKTDAWEYSGYFSGSSTQGTGDMDSAIDVIRLAKDDDMNPLVLKLFPWPETETADLSDSGTDIGKGGGLVLNTGNSPAYVTLDGGGKTIPLTAGNTGSVITVDNGVTLTLRNITFKGSAANNVALIRVNGGGKLVLEDGAVITGNITSGSGGGVSVGGTLVMNGGAISGNSASWGGGVYVTSNSATFDMNGGKISGNTASTNGGGVAAVGSTSTFTMNKGEISGNTANGGSSYFGGGGVVISFSNFKMTGGVISGNNTDWYGGGVFLRDSETFIKTGGVIYGYTAGSALSNWVGSRKADGTPNTHTATNRGDVVFFYGGGNKHLETALGEEDDFSVDWQGNPGPW
jgi:hypothetical protein